MFFASSKAFEPRLCQAGRQLEDDAEGIRTKQKERAIGAPLVTALTLKIRPRRFSPLSAWPFSLKQALSVQHSHQ